MSRHLQPLNSLQAGQTGRIARIEAAEGIRQRLLEMGFTRGEHITVAKLAPLGDPMELVLKHGHLALRRHESACILVERED